MRLKLNKSTVQLPSFVPNCLKQLLRKTAKISIGLSVSPRGSARTRRSLLQRTSRARPTRCARGASIVAWSWDTRHRQTVLIGTRTHTSPRLYYKPAPPLHGIQETPGVGKAQL